jgi:two-component system, cell cycle sensor histidine kinase and response regulator CckA
MKAPVPSDELERLKALHGYHILDTAAEKQFDDIALLASRICETPIAMISLIDEDRQWFKAKVGTEMGQTSRDESFCAHGILQAEVFVVPDATADKRFAENPMVKGNPKIRFYAGAPLRTADGHAIGMICVKDQVPRKLTTEQISALGALGRQVMAQLELKRSVGELRETIDQLHRAEKTMQLLRSTVEQSKESMLVTDADIELPGPRIVFVNAAFTSMTGYTEEEVVGKTPRILQGPKTDKAVLNRLRQNLKNGEVFEGDTINYRKDGSEFHIEWQVAPIRNADGKITHYSAIQRDISERKGVQARLFQSQKMETVGKLAGGVAHEFNSILTAIIGQSELLLGNLSPGSTSATSALEIRRAADRASTLTRQLLAYGRKQILQPQVLDLNDVVTEMVGTLSHLMGREIDIQVTSAKNLKKVKIDPGQIEQVIVNLAMNAADAMPNGGKFMLELSNTDLTEDYCLPFPGLKPGPYVMLAVSDTGIGMTNEVKARAFEPFYSTKGVGQGVGLGLATIYGILKQSEGHINVYSEVSRGTTFKIYLPETRQSGIAQATPLRTGTLPKGTETILLAEDDPSLLALCTSLLRGLGYNVLTATNGVEALSLKQQRNIGHIDLLFTDVVMPHMSGKELSDRVRAIYPATKLLFTSAYTENAIIHQGLLDGHVDLLQKPFTPSALAHKVRQVLDQPAPLIHENHSSGR